MDRPGQAGILSKHGNGVLENLPVGHDAGAPDTALSVGFYDPVGDAAADPQVIGMDDQPYCS